MQLSLELQHSYQDTRGNLKALHLKNHLYMLMLPLTPKFSLKLLLLEAYETTGKKVIGTFKRKQKTKAERR